MFPFPEFPLPLLSLDMVGFGASHHSHSHFRPAPKLCPRLLLASPPVPTAVAAIGLPTSCVVPAPPRLKPAAFCVQPRVTLAIADVCPATLDLSLPAAYSVC